ncbi:MAG: hypothetical protein R3Y62_04895, partial [Eubacteriales bacterium]
MKRICRAILSLALILSALTGLACANNTVETTHFTFDNVTEQTQDGVTYLEATSFATVTLTKDLWMVTMNYYDQDRDQALPMDPAVTDRSGQLVMDADITIRLNATGETMDYYDWREAMLDGSVTWDDDPIWVAGSSFTLHVFGEFYFYAYDSESVYTLYAVDIVAPQVEEEAEILESGTAITTPSTVYVDGAEVAFDAYKINDNNYFKLRDIAAVLSGSVKEFAVTWNEDDYAISLISGQDYTAVGGELTPGDGSAKDYTPAEATLFVDGAEVSLTAYEIQGNNYFKLRDL